MFRKSLSDNASRGKKLVELRISKWQEGNKMKKLEANSARVPAHCCVKDASKQYLEGILYRERKYEMYIDHCKDTQNKPVSKSVSKTAD
jgi:hypothetical protein